MFDAPRTGEGEEGVAATGPCVPVCAAAPSDGRGGDKVCVCVCVQRGACECRQGYHGEDRGVTLEPPYITRTLTLKRPHRTASGTSACN